jgi:CheY-like chemotaxis protein/nitrogen-specific signal transduction histidine kinase
MDQMKVDNFDEMREQLLVLEQSARAQTEAADRMKDEFLATLSHEIRTPLNSILGWVTLLRNGCLSPEEEQRALEVIERNARFQKHLINDLLDVSNIISGNLRLNVQPVMPEQAISKAVESVRPAAAAKGIRLEIEFSSHAGPISADIQRLQQMVWNLLVNAIKFTPEGGRVQLRMETMNSHIKIIVSDTGIGIKPELLPFVFDRFRQGDSSTTRRFGGLGLGLAIVRYMAEMHGGTVSVESAGENCGTTFTIELPVSAAHMALEERQSRTLLKMNDEAPDREIHAELTDVRVLVVEDDPDSRRLLETILSRCHAEVQTASNGAEALALLQRWRPDVIVSDIEMPEMDGVELIRCLRKRKNLARIPAAALTAYTRVEDRLRSLSAGFQMHLAKPVEPRELLAVVASLTGRFNHAKTVAETA